MGHGQATIAPSPLRHVNFGGARVIGRQPIDDEHFASMARGKGLRTSDRIHWNGEGPHSDPGDPGNLSCDGMYYQPIDRRVLTGRVLGHTASSLAGRAGGDGQNIAVATRAL